MHHSESLFAFAQVAVAFAGFASLIAFLGKRTTGPYRQLERNRLIGMVRVALVAIAFALLPVVVGAQGLSEESAWRVSAFLFAAAHSAITIIAWRRTLWMLREKIRDGMPFIPPMSTLALIALIFAVGLPAQAAGLYLAALFLVVGISGALFFGLVRDFLSDDE